MNAAAGRRERRDDEFVTRSRQIVVWVGATLAVAGAAGALVAWFGLDRANAYLGVTAAVAAVLGLGVSIYTLVRDWSVESKSAPTRTVRQRARAADRAQVTQVAGDAIQGSANGRPHADEHTTVRQQASAVGEARIVQTGGDQSSGEPR